MKTSADFLGYLAQRSVGQVPVPSQDEHERIARAVIAENPVLVQKAVETGDYLSLIRIATSAAPGLSKFWLAQRIGQLARSVKVPTPRQEQTP